MVTRFWSWPLESSALPVVSVSTTTWYSFPPATTSSAVAIAGSVTRMSFATTPLTLERSNLASGSRNLKSKPASWPFRTSVFSCASRNTFSAASKEDSKKATRSLGDEPSEESDASSSEAFSSFSFAASNADCAFSSSFWSFPPSFSLAARLFSASLRSFSACFARMRAALTEASDSLARFVASASCVWRDLFPSPPAPVPDCTPRSVFSALTAFVSAAARASCFSACDASSFARRASSRSRAASCLSASARAFFAFWRSPFTASFLCVQAAFSLTRAFEASSARFARGRFASPSGPRDASRLSFFLRSATSSSVEAIFWRSASRSPWRRSSFSSFSAIASLSSSPSWAASFALENSYATQNLRSLSSASFPAAHFM